MGRLGEIRKIYSLFLYPDQLKLQSWFSENLQHESHVVKEWKFSANSLEILIEGDKVDALGYVKQLQREPGIYDVKAQSMTKDNQVRLQLRIRESEKK